MNAAAYVAGELRTPSRTLHTAVVGGTLGVTALHVGLNLLYLRTVPFPDLEGSVAVADVAAGAVFGRWSAQVVAAVVARARAGGVSAMLVAGPRVYFAMARDGALPPASPSTYGRGGARARLRVRRHRETPHDARSDREPLVRLAAAAALLVIPAGAAAQGQDAHRDAFQRVPDVVGALGAVPGARVADVGAGGGYFTEYLGRAVGAEGRVYAVDISRQAVARLRYGLDLEGARNVDVILGEPDDPRLPYRSLDGALIVNAYHEMTEFAEMLAAIRSAPRPGERLVILDNPPPDSIGGRAAQTEGHQIGIDFVAGDLAEAGFEVLERSAGFIDDDSDGHAHRIWMLVSRRPLRDAPVQRLAVAPPGLETSSPAPSARRPSRSASA